MNRADWIGRALCLAVTFGVARLQAEIYSPVNSLLSAGIQTVLSALTNTCALLAAAAFIKGKASFDLQRLAYCALVINLLNFAAFAAKSSPFVYVFNTSITVISYAQLMRILWPSNGATIDILGRVWLRGLAHLPRAGLHMETKK